MTNNQALVQLMQQHQLTVAQVAEILEMSPWTVKNWVRPSLSKGFRKMPDLALKVLLMSTEQLPQQEQETPTSSTGRPDLEFLPAEKTR